MIYLIKLLTIILLLNNTSILANENKISENKIKFKINNKVFTSIDIENRKNYLELLNQIKVDDAEINNIINDYISSLIFSEYYNLNKIRFSQLNEKVNNLFIDKFDNLNLPEIDKQIIYQNITIDFIRQLTIEEILNTKKNEIFEKTSDLDLLYNFNIKYVTTKKENAKYFNLDKILNRSDLLNIENNFINNNVKYLIKENNINNTNKLSTDLKSLINENKKILIKENHNLITIISLEKKLASYENIYVTLVNIKINDQIENNNLNCEYVNNFKDKKSFKEYKYSSLNDTIKNNLFKVNDFILLKENDIYSYIFLCDMRFDKDALNQININKKVQNLAESIENNFIKKYYDLYNIEILNE